MENQLIDKFGRKHEYLRISLLERCNLRCTYCMPEEGIELRNKMEFMTQEELLMIAKTFVELGIKKIRLTGGEPLIKKDFREILFQLSQLPVEISLTTNAVLLDKYIEDLQQAEVKNLNISIDSLIEDRFNQITRRKDYKRIIQNINRAIDANFKVKLNVVLMKGINDDELIDFIEFTKDRDVAVRFIEFMPFDGNQWDWSKKVSEIEIKNTLLQHYGNSITPLDNPPNSTAKNFKVENYTGSFGLISTLTNPFCDSCNRLRLTADGKIKNCLFSSEEISLLEPLRAQKDIRSIILSTVHKKHPQRAGINSFEDKEGAAIFSQNRSMTTIGG